MLTFFKLVFVVVTVLLTCVKLAFVIVMRLLTFVKLVFVIATRLLTFVKLVFVVVYKLLIFIKLVFVVVKRSETTDNRLFVSHTIMLTFINETLFNVSLLDITAAQELYATVETLVSFVDVQSLNPGLQFVLDKLIFSTSAEINEVLKLTFVSRLLTV